MPIAWFRYVKSRRVSTGTSQYGFAGDGTGSNKVPYLATGAWGRVNQRQIRTQGISVVQSPAQSILTGIPNVAQAPGSVGLITANTAPVQDNIDLS